MKYKKKIIDNKAIKLFKKPKNVKKFKRFKKSLNLKFGRKLLLGPKRLILNRFTINSKRSKKLKNRRILSVGLNKYALALRKLTQQASCKRIRTRKIFRRLRFRKFLYKYGRKFFDLHASINYLRLLAFATRPAYIENRIDVLSSKLKKDLVNLRKRKDLKSLASRLVISRVARGYLVRRQVHGREKAKKWLLLQFGKEYHPGKGKIGQGVLSYYRFKQILDYKKSLQRTKRERWASISWSKFVNSRYFVMLRQTTNNCFVTVINKMGRVLYVCSTGLVGFKGPRRTTQPAGEAVGNSVAKFILRRRLYNLGVILYTPINFQIRAIVSGLEFKRIRYSGIIDLVPVAHNGIRKKKIRRV